MALLFSGFSDGPNLTKDRLLIPQSGDFVIIRHSTGDLSLHSRETLNPSSSREVIAGITIRTHTEQTCAQLTFEPFASDIHILVNTNAGQSSTIHLAIPAEEDDCKNVLVLTPGIGINFPGSEARISYSLLESEQRSHVISSTPIERQVLKQLDENPNPDYKVDVTASLDPKEGIKARRRLARESTTQISASNTKILETPRAQRIKPATDMAESQEGSVRPYATANDEPTTNEEFSDDKLAPSQVDPAGEATDSDQSPPVTQITKKRGRPKKEATKRQPPNKKARVTVAETVEDASVMSPVATASTASSDGLSRPVLNGKMWIVFSSSKVLEQAKLKQYIERNVSVAKNVTDKVTYLCVGKGELKRTSKVLLAVAHGIPIINDQWFIQSARADKLLDPLDFLASDKTAEKSTGVDTDWSSGQACPTLFDKMSFYITPALKATYGQGYKDISKLITVLGGKVLPSGSAKAVKIETKKLLVLGLAEDDLDAVTLDEKKVPCFDREWLPLAILRRHADMEDNEHRLALTDDVKPKKGRGKKT